MEELEEGSGESSPPVNKGLHGLYFLHEIKNEIYTRLVESGNKEALSNPSLREQLDEHFNRLPASYALDVHVDTAEDVLLHRRILIECEDPDKRPVFHARFLKYVLQTLDDDDEQHRSPSVGSSPQAHESGAQYPDVPESPRGEFEPCTRLEDLKLGFPYPNGANGRDCTNEVLSARLSFLFFNIIRICFLSSVMSR